MDKPDVDLIEGLSPAISIEQKATSHNPRSTVGTVTEIHLHLRLPAGLLFARAGGSPRCPRTRKLMVLAPVELADTDGEPDGAGLCASGSTATGV